MTSGGVLVLISGTFFYFYFQNLLGAGVSSTSGSSTSITNALGLYNGTANTPVFVTLGIFGFAFLIVGAVFIVGGHMGQQLADRLETVSPDSPVTVGSPVTASIPMPSKACTKCGSLLYQTSGYCPNCGNPVTKIQVASPQTG